MMNMFNRGNAIAQENKNRQIFKVNYSKTNLSAIRSPGYLVEMRRLMQEWKMFAA